MRSRTSTPTPCPGTDFAARTRPLPTTLDLTKGYWQVPLTKAAQERMAFATPGGLYQYTVLQFSVHGKPATIQRMMDQLLRPHQAYAAAYIRRYHNPQRQLGCPPPTAAGSRPTHHRAPLGLEETSCLGYQVGRGRGGGTPGEQGCSHPGLAPPHLQKTGEIVSWPGRVSPASPLWPAP